MLALEYAQYIINISYLRLHKECMLEFLIDLNNVCIQIKWKVIVIWDNVIYNILFIYLISWKFLEEIVNMFQLRISRIVWLKRFPVSFKIYKYHILGDTAYGRLIPNDAKPVPYIFSYLYRLLTETEQILLLNIQIFCPE